MMVLKDLNAILEELRPQMTETLRRWVRIPSVKSEPQPGAPFGAEVRRALDTALADAKAMGFETRNIDGYAGDVRMGPLGVNPLAILAHLDVVPAGDGWKTDPFGAEMDGDRVYGRGASDDKGPAVAALYAMYAVKLLGVELKREVRLILGCDEESGFECMRYYAAHCDMPRTGFSPDCTYPVINTEKGLLHLELAGAYSSEGLRVRDIRVGERCNVIPGLASALVEDDGNLKERALSAAAQLGAQATAEDEDGAVRLTVHGVPGHAAYPQAAQNALGKLVRILGDLGAQGALGTLARRVGDEYDGLGLGVRCQDETSGALTCNLGILRYNAKDGLYASLDIRFPILASGDALVKHIRAALEPEIHVTVEGLKQPHHVSPDSPLVAALLDAYHEVTGRPRECVATGGGTYARTLEEGVAFGCSFPEDEELAHQAGEYFSIGGMLTNVRIFIKAIENLQH